MSETLTRPAPARTRVTTGIPPLPPARGLTLGMRRVGYEVKQYFRSPDQVFFTFLFPTVLFTVFASAFEALGEVTAPDGTGIPQAAYYLPGMIAAGLLLSGVQNLAIDIATEKGDGTLKRLGGSPLPVTAYLLGKLGQVFATSVLQLALLLVVAAVGFGVPLPSDPTAWFTFAWVYVLGIVTSAVLGVALSAVPRSGKSASAVVIPIVLVLQFISGVYLAFMLLPEWLQQIASAFPLKWIAQGMRAVFLPESFAALEMGGSWELPLVALVLGVWCVAGLAISSLTFRWIRKDS